MNASLVFHLPVRSSADATLPYLLDPNDELCAPNWERLVLLTIPKRLGGSALAPVGRDFPLSIEIVSTRMLASEVIELARSEDFAAICFADLPPSAPSKTRYLTKRLRVALPHVPIVVGRWAPAELKDENTQSLRESGASLVPSSLVETRIYLGRLLGILSPDSADGLDMSATSIGAERIVPATAALA